MNFSEYVKLEKEEEEQQMGARCAERYGKDMRNVVEVAALQVRSRRKLGLCVVKVHRHDRQVW